MPKPENTISKFPVLGNELPQLKPTYAMGKARVSPFAHRVNPKLAGATQIGGKQFMSHGLG